MAKKLKRIFDPGVDEVVQNFTIQSWHVSQFVDAFTGVDDYDISISGSLAMTGSVTWTGSQDAAGNPINVIVIDQSTDRLYTTSSATFGSTDYISDVTYKTGSIDFTGNGSAFDGEINISDITASLLSTASFNAATSSFLPDTPNYSVQFNDDENFGGSDLLYLTSSGVFTSDAALEVTGSYVNLIKNKSALDWGKDVATGRLTFNSNSNRSGSAVIALPGNKDLVRPGNLYISNNAEALPRFFVSSSGKVAINFNNDPDPVTEPQFDADIQMGSLVYPVDVFISGTLAVSNLPNTVESNILYYNTSSGVFSYATNTPTVAAYSAPIANSIAVSTGTVTTASWGTPTVSNPSVYSYSTGSIAVLSDGVYSISFQGLVASSYSVNSRIQMGILKNGVAAGFGGYATDTLGPTEPENDAMLGATIILSLTAGDTIEVGGTLITGGGTGTMAFGNLNYGGISITKLS